VTEISIKTGTVDDAESDCGAELEICNVEGVCCKTSKLDNKPGYDRESGQTDVYTKGTVLGACANEVRKLCLINNFFHFTLQGSLLGDIKTAKLTIGGDNKEDGSLLYISYLIRFFDYL